MPTTLHNEAAIAGIGQTAYSKNSGVSELSLSTECVRKAIDDETGTRKVRVRDILRASPNSKSGMPTLWTAVLDRWMAVTFMQ